MGGERCPIYENVKFTMFVIRAHDCVGNTVLSLTQGQF
jgi:hypothetical protein